MKLYLVEAESGCTDHGSAMCFDSVWSSRELAERHCEKFKTSGNCGHPWPFEITEITLDKA